MTLRTRPEHDVSIDRRALCGWAALAPWAALSPVALPNILACEEPHVQAPPTGPRFERPIEVIPPDLQLTLRVAVRRLRESLGNQVVERVRADSQLGAPLADPLIGWALERADTAWASFRLGLAPEQTDNVLVLWGNFAELAPDRSHWLTPVDLGAGWQRWDKSAPVARAEPTRLYAYTGEVLVFVSEAEIDAVERRLERGVEVESIEPPELGLVSIAASMPALAHALKAKAPRAAELLEKGTVLTGHADFEHTTGATLELDFGFKAQEQAERSARAAELLLAAIKDTPGVLGTVARAAKVEALGKSVGLRLRLETATLGSMLARSQASSTAPEGSAQPQDSAPPEESAQPQESAPPEGSAAP